MRCPDCGQDASVYGSGALDALYLSVHGTNRETCSGSGLPVSALRVDSTPK